jgi:NAD(P)-dependent dehydrogenase (short-subunit alcohol dehydrogenase family)
LTLPLCDVTLAAMTSPRRTALVTGAGSGIGRATAQALARHGAHVLAVDIDADAAAKTAADVGGSSYAVDVADRDAMLGLAAQVHDEYGALDVLVNNAGVGMTGRFLDTGLTDWDWIVRINLMGVVHGCHAFGRAMVERGRGHVVNVASGMAYGPRATEPAYCATKAAVLSLSYCLRADWMGHGVGVSAICPGVINTAIPRSTRYLGERVAAQADVRRLFEKRGHPPERVADAIVEAIRHNTPVVPVGVESKVLWALHGLVPARLVARAARVSVRGV